MRARKSREPYRFRPACAPVQQSAGTFPRFAGQEELRRRVSAEEEASMEAAHTFQGTLVDGPGRRKTEVGSRLCDVDREHLAQDLGIFNHFRIFLLDAAEVI